MADASNQTTREHREAGKKSDDNAVIQSESSKSTKERLEDLKTRITNVEQLTKEYEKEGLVIPNAEKFIHDCEAIKRKIDKQRGEERINYLKDHVAELEDLTAEVNKDDNLASHSFNEFIESCKEFKNRLDERKNADSKTVCEGCMIDKQKGLISYSIDKYLQSCGHSKCHIRNEKKETIDNVESDTIRLPESPPDVLKCLSSNVNVMIDLINKSKATKTLTPSVEEFLEICENFKSKLNSYITDDEKICVCLVCGNIDDKEDARESNINTQVEREVCGHRRRHRPTCASEEFTATCSHKHNKSNASNKQNRMMCCADDQNQNYVGTQIRKVRKIVRTRNPDGTIKEEKETITIDTKDMVQMK